MFTPHFFGGSLAVYGREEADPVFAAGGAGRFLISRGGSVVRCIA
jgi:hypothetical protein